MGMMELRGDKWRQECPVTTNYTVAEAATILGGVSHAWVGGLSAPGELLYGPDSTLARPIDHQALVQYITARERRYARRRARKELMSVLQEHLADADTCD